MKTILFTVIALLCMTIVSAQSSSINYKAIIKDGSGNVLVTQGITVQLSVLKGTSLTNIYQETHTPTTDANGVVILNIGEGTVDSGVYEDIDWAEDEHSLNVQIDIGSGLVDMGTTQFLAVPYALSAANVTGLEALDEGNGNGWRLKGRDPLNYGDIGFNAADLSYSNSTSSTKGATGFYSTAMGFLTTASESSSTAMGVLTMASDYASTAMGSITVASGYISTAMGENTQAASSYSMAIGRYNVGGGDSFDWIGTDPLFEIGNGNILTQSNALTVLKNGTIIAPTFDLAEITDDKALITKEYADNNLTASGLETLDEGNGIGWRLKGKDPNNFGDIGLDAVDLSYSSSTSTTNGATGFYSTTMGFDTTASGNGSTAFGGGTTASGLWSTAMGLVTTASNTSATAMGNATTASGLWSTAMGIGTTASGKNSTALGDNTKAEAASSLAIGAFNVGGGDPANWVLTDPLFEVGNGTGIGSESNALTVLKNGNTGIGTETPDTELHVVHANVSLASGLKIENTFSNYWRLLTASNANGDLRFHSSTNGDNNTATINGSTGVYTAISDRRLKTNFNELYFDWNSFMNLEPLTYSYKRDKKSELQIGMVAQDVETIYPELVNYNEEDDVYHLNYSGFGVVAIKAVQELKEEVNLLKEENEQLKAKLSKLEALEARITSLEANFDSGIIDSKE